MTELLDLSPLAPFGLDLDQYFGLWCCEESRFVQAFERVSRMDLAAHLRTQLAAGAQQRTTEGGGRTRGKIALVSLEGVMTKRGSSLSGTEGTIAVRQRLRAAARSAEVDGILLRIDSPGGTVAGTAELGNDVARIAQQKPVYAFIEDIGASAAYWVASQATKVFANDPTAEVGSIGTLIAFYDLSAAAAMQGVKPVVIKAGALKGTGVEGTEITDDQKAYLQEIVDATQAEFTAAIARGRGMSLADVQQSVTGRVYMAADALDRGLIDAIAGFDEAVADLAAAASTNSTRKGTYAMSAPKTETPTAAPESSAPSVETPTAAPASSAPAAPAKPAAASFEELVIGLELDMEDAGDKSFCFDCQAQSLTLAQARTAYLKRQRELIAAAKQATPAADGVDTIGTAKASDDGAGADAATAWQAAVDAELKAGAKNRQDAARRANRKHPELRNAMLAAAN